VGSDFLIKTIIVEDDPMVAELNKRYINLVAGFEVCAVLYSADEALQMLDQCDVDIILLDVFMSGMNGIELLMKIREKGKNIDVIIVSAACDNATIMQALRFGAIDYIIKPFEFERLNDALIKYKELINVMTVQNMINQVDLDNIRSKDHLNIQVPKGIDRNTLKRVWGKVRYFKQTAFSTEEMAAQVGISRVSMRKYLEFMKEIAVLKLELIYGTIGRPVYKYRATGLSSQIIIRYF
jgi:two-component system, CitB family, response regulator MalR